MSPRPPDIAEAREQLRQTLADAKAERDRIFAEADRLREAAEAKYWKTVGTELDGAYHGARTDAVDVLGVTRDYILKQTKKYS
ncbi:hypothetical protein [Streptomyces sp. MS2.AVA.5]|uniref:Uncharacterized protein n=1 Tax=Streptomyces achmelvichensis TaxID=3134111 RepID=A0ACC6PKV5_9ACTN